MRWMAMAMMAAAVATAASPATARPVASVESDRAAFVQQADAIRERARGESRAAMEAAELGRYKMALERFAAAWELLSGERRALESAYGQDPLGEKVPDLKKRLRANAEEAAEMTRTMSLLRIAAR